MWHTERGELAPRGNLLLCTSVPIKHKEIGKKNPNFIVVWKINDIFVFRHVGGSKANWRHWRKWTPFFSIDCAGSYHKPITSSFRSISLSLVLHNIQPVLHTLRGPAAFFTSCETWRQNEAKCYNSTVFYRGNLSNLFEHSPEKSTRALSCGKEWFKLLIGQLRPSVLTPLPFFH